MVQCYVNAIHADVQVNSRLMVMWERTARCGRTKIEVGPTYNLKIGTYYSVVIWKRRRLSNLMPMVVKIVGSTPTARTINESEVVGVLDTEQNKQIYETGRRKQTDLRV